MKLTILQPSITLILVLLFSPLVAAGTATSGHPHRIHYMSSGVVMFYTTGTRSDVPGCATNQPGRFAINTSTDGGKSQLSGLLTAYATGKPIIIFGTDSCTIYGDTESVAFFYVDE